MQTIALIAQKGGTGKTTLALSLAVAAEKHGISTLIVDLDPQASACKWGDRRTVETPAIIDAQPARLQQALMKAEQAGFRLAIVDTPARIEQAAAEAARIADLVILPTKPSIYDLETLQASLELVKGRSQRPPVVVVNATPPHGGRYDQAVEAIKKMGLLVCPASLGYRVAFEYAAQLGQSAAEYEPGGKAAEEIEAVYKAIRRLIDMSTDQGKRIKETKGKTHEQAAQSR